MFKNFKPSRVLVMVGLSGSGKSFVARNIAESLKYRILRSDVIRKRLAGMDPLKRSKEDFGRGIYSAEMTKRVYTTMVKEAKKILSEGGRVILDATFLKKWQRELILRNLPSAVFIWVFAPEEEVRKRLAERKNDPSDADYEIYLKQKESFEPPSELLTTFVIRSEEWEKLIPYLTNRNKIYPK